MGVAALGLFASAFAGGHQRGLSPTPDAVPDAVQRSQLVGHTDPNQALHISVNLLPSDEAGLQAYADSVSNPRSPNYRQFLTPSEIGQRFGRSQAVAAQYVNYLKSAGFQVTLVADDNLHILADGTVSQAEAAFHTTINNFHALDPNEPGRTDYFSYTAPPQLPSGIAPLVQHIGGLQDQSMPVHRTTLTPLQAHVLYNIAPEYNAKLYGQNRTVAISNWDGYRISLNVPKWYTKYNLPAPSGGVDSNITVITIDGGSGTGSPGAEGDLDIQMVLGQAPQCTELIYDGGFSSGSEPTDVLTREFNDNKADVISESYGWNLNSSTLTSCHTLHQEMSAEGITYLAASGDNGTKLDPYCYPDIEPEVLLVGGAAAQTDTNGNFQSETAWNGGGGGWSTNSASFNVLPSWQRATGCPTNINHRLVPDIAAQAAGDEFLHSNAVFFYYNGSLSTVSGTSVASPLMAGDLAIAEQKLILLGGLPADSHGHQRFGRINDLFYSQNLRSDVWYDITVGHNGTLPNGSSSNAGTGWDFCTGLGSINWDAFVNSVAPAGVTITSLSPTSAALNSTFTLTVNGTGFASGAVVNWNGSPLSTTFVSATQVTASVPSSDTGTAGTYPITVTVGSTTSNAVNFTVNNPSPTLSSVSPNSIAAGSGNTTITLTGTNFVSTSVANVNGTPISTTYVSGTSLTAVVPASDLTSPGNLSVTVTNPTPGGGTSGAQTITVTVALSISSLSPSSALVGTSFTLTVNGAGFVSGATVDWNGSPLTTTFVSSTQLTASVTTTQTATAGTYPVTVVNPDNTTSNAINFTVNNPAPTLTSMSPNTANAGSSDTTITLTGSNFVSTSTVQVNGTGISTTYVSGSTLTAVIPAADLASAGSLTITVTNPAPGGGTSNGLTFQVVGVPTITTISPTSATIGSSFTLTVNGTNYVNGSVINWNGSALTTTFVSSTQLTASITSTQTGTAGTYPITVTNPNGAGTSNSVNFTVTSSQNNPVPTLLFVSPGTIPHGSGNTTITCTGSNFISSSSVTINGTAISTTFVSGSKLTAVIPASMLTVAGHLTVKVVNPPPGGGTSGGFVITVT